MANIFQSFDLHDTLNPEIWMNADSDDFSLIKLYPDIRKKLLSIVDLFVETIKIPSFQIEDIILVGSIANYNWSEYSDIDLHLLVNKEKFSLDPETLDDYFNVKKQWFNYKHDLKIKGFDAEIYIQGSNEENASMGVYSVMTNMWKKTPQKNKVEINKENIRLKIKTFLVDINTIEQMINEKESPTKILKLIENLKEKIKKYRQSGLAKGGEYSDENLVFKYLRRTDYLQKLGEFKIKSINQMYSLKELETKTV